MRSNSRLALRSREAYAGNAGNADLAKGVALFRNRQFEESAKFYEGVAASDTSMTGKKAG